MNDSPNHGGPVGGGDGDEGSPTRLDPIDVSAIAGKAPGSASIAKQREDVREFLAKRLLALLAGTLLLGAAMMMTRRWTQITAEDTRIFFQVAFSAIIALVSAATGFYFGSGSGGSNQGGSS